MRMSRSSAQRKRARQKKLKDRAKLALQEVGIAKKSPKPETSGSLNGASIASNADPSPVSGKPKSQESQANPFPWVLLLVGASFLLLGHPGVLLIWSTDPPIKLTQDAVLLVGLNGAWWVLRAILALQFHARSQAPPPSRGESFADYLELLLTRTAACALCGTFLALMAMPTVQSEKLKATTVLADLATVGAVAGLAICIPKSYMMGRQAFKSLREFDRRTWKLAHAAFLVADLIVYLEIYLVLLDMYAYLRSL
jgi:hypothetical protein